jgi:hypothetical protein
MLERIPPADRTEVRRNLVNFLFYRQVWSIPVNPHLFADLSANRKTIGQHDSDWRQRHVGQGKRAL